MAGLVSQLVLIMEVAAAAVLRQQVRLEQEQPQEMEGLVLPRPSLAVASIMRVEAAQD
jgi:hypothetical protein